jgi:hypothetical protein
MILHNKCKKIESTKALTSSHRPPTTLQMAYIAVVKSENIRFKHESLNTTPSYFHVDTYEELYEKIIQHYGLERVSKLNKLFLYDRPFGYIQRVCLNETKQLTPLTNSNIIDVWLRIPFSSTDQSSSSPSTISL